MAFLDCSPYVERPTWNDSLPRMHRRVLSNSVRMVHELFDDSVSTASSEIR